MTNKSTTMTNKSATMKLTLKVTSFIFRLLLNIVFYILVVIVIVNVSKMAYEFTYQLYGPVTVDPVGHGTPVVFQIKKGEKSMDIASKLEVNRVINNKYSFYLKVKFNDYAIMPGTYEISTDMTYNEILAIITDYSASIIKDEDTAADKESTTGADTKADTNSDAATDTNSDTDSDTGTDTN